MLLQGHPCRDKLFYGLNIYSILIYLYWNHEFRSFSRALHPNVLKSIERIILFVCPHTLVDWLMAAVLIIFGCSGCWTWNPWPGRSKTFSVLPQLCKSTLKAYFNGSYFLFVKIEVRHLLTTNCLNSIIAMDQMTNYRFHSSCPTAVAKRGCSQSFTNSAGPPPAAA